MKRQVRMGKYIITYTFIEKQVKNINLHLNQNGEIVVSANPYVPIEKVDAFVCEKISWIVEKQQAILKRKQMNDPMTHFAYMGKSYPIEVIISKFETVKLEKNQCVVYAQDTSHVPAILDQFALAQCKQIFLPVVQEIYEKMQKDYNLTYPVIKIRKMKTRWGSCMPAKHQITLNQRLIHYDPQFLEYVVLHEFAHFIQPNHSKQFYYVIEKYMPDYKQASKLYQHLMVGEESL